jgi:hypothetical protein
LVQWIDDALEMARIGRKRTVNDGSDVFTSANRKRKYGRLFFTVMRAVRILLPSSAKCAAAAILNISILLSAVVLVEGRATVITGEQ